MQASYGTTGLKSLPIIDSATSCATTTAKSATRAGTKGRYSFISLGCPKNLVDSERMLGRLRDEGYELVPDTDGVDFVVINTCGFIDNARTESFQAIDQMLELKRQGKIRGVIVAGCLAEREREKLLEARPEIDSLVGVFGRDEITKLADRLIDPLDEQRTIFRPAPIRALDDSQRLRITPKHFAYLKISEGCDRLCTFCAIPKMRGKHASKPQELILAEARELVESGVRELIVVAQDTTYWGMDIYGRPMLTELLKELSQVEGLDWIRLMYFYPMYIDEQLLDVIADTPNILPYIDMPLQHINGDMLRRMSRRVTPDETRRLVERMRARIDGLVLRTTFITGFPGETEQHVDELADFIAQSKFERLGVFTYSLEPDTPAARLDGHLPDEVKQARRDRLMQVQQQVAFDWTEQTVGNAFEVMIDKPFDVQRNVWIGRTYADAPDVDAVVYVTGQPRHPVASGRIMPVEVVGHKDYDLIAATVGTGR